MRSTRFAAVLAVLALPALLVPRGAAAEEIKGAAILDHACGKVAVKHMGLVHAGKMDEAVKLGTSEMQEHWKSMSAGEREMMSGMMKDMSQSEADFSAEIKANGVLQVEGDKATLTVEKKTTDANGTSTETTTQRYLIDAKGCWISH
jgi:hypothetical protein